MGSAYLPTTLELFHLLERQELVLGAFMVGAGLVFMILGLRIFNVLVAVSFGFAGFVAGRSLPVSELMQWVFGLAGAVGLAIASTFVMKVSVAILAGGWSGCLATAMSGRFGLSEQLALAGGGLALVIVISLTFVMYEQIIAFVTSLEGTLLFLGGGVVLLSHSPSLWNSLRSLLCESVVFLPFLVLAGTTTGFYLQLTDLRQKQSGAGG